MELDTQLAQLYATESMQLNVIVPRTQRQKEPYDCGLFALATATCIAAGVDPVTQTWDQNNMRAHCNDCIQKERASLFPASTRGMRTGKLPQSHQFTVDLICDCKLPEFAFNKSNQETVTHAIQCDGCNFWFHNHCYGFPNKSLNCDFVCRTCSKRV